MCLLYVCLIVSRETIRHYREYAQVGKTTINCITLPREADMFYCFVHLLT